MLYLIGVLLSAAAAAILWLTTENKHTCDKCERRFHYSFLNITVHELHTDEPYGEDYDWSDDPGCIHFVTCPHCQERNILSVRER
jgi:hypothetical protein